MKRYMWTNFANRGLYRTATTTQYITTTTTIFGAATVITTYQPPPVGKLMKRAGTTLIPSSIPSYASPCSGSSRYSSACSCIGVTRKTTTGVTTTITSTVTSAGPTTTLSITTTKTALSFRLSYNNGPAAGSYIGTTVTMLTVTKAFATAGETNAAVFHLDDNNILRTDTKFVAAALLTPNADVAYFKFLNNPADNASSYSMPCSINQGTFELTCAATANSKVFENLFMSTSDTTVQLAKAGFSDSSYTSVVIKAIPIL
ncbi:hypothetical protein ABW20_dc0100454 [Dactylellina cionopaga]|nr:hypothetical protein ABW20_dc0100454 [Dactylellina cionopaga]